MRSYVSSSEWLVIFGVTIQSSILKHSKLPLQHATFDGHLWPQYKTLVIGIQKAVLWNLVGATTTLGIAE